MYSVKDAPSGRGILGPSLIEGIEVKGATVLRNNTVWLDLGWYNSYADTAFFTTKFGGMDKTKIKAIIFRFCPSVVRKGRLPGNPIQMHYHKR